MYYKIAHKIGIHGGFYVYECIPVTITCTSAAVGAVVMTHLTESHQLEQKFEIQKSKTDCNEVFRLCGALLTP
jgi:hypothetical protein